MAYKFEDKRGHRHEFDFQARTQNRIYDDLDESYRKNINKDTVYIGPLDPTKETARWQLIAAIGIGAVAGMYCYNAIGDGGDAVEASFLIAAFAFIVAKIVLTYFTDILKLMVLIIFLAWLFGFIHLPS